MIPYLADLLVLPLPCLLRTRQHLIDGGLNYKNINIIIN